MNWIQSSPELRLIIEPCQRAGYSGHTQMVAENIVWVKYSLLSEQRLTEQGAPEDAGCNLPFSVILCVAQQCSQCGHAMWLGLKGESTNREDPRIEGAVSRGKNKVRKWTGFWLQGCIIVSYWHLISSRIFLRSELTCTLISAVDWLLRQFISCRESPHQILVVLT